MNRQLSSLSRRFDLHANIKPGLVLKAEAKLENIVKARSLDVELVVSVNTVANSLNPDQARD